MDQSHDTLPSENSSPLASYSKAGQWKNFILVTNSKSGSSRGDALHQLAEEKAREHGKNLQIIDLHPAIDTEIEHAVAEGAQVLIAAGGDGTVASMATIAYRLGVPLGVIPSGTANLFARELGIPLQAEGAFDLLFTTEATRAVDAIIIENKVYLCHVTVGTYSTISRETTSDVKQRYGRLAYIWKGIQLLMRKNLWTFHLEVDGRKMRRRASTLMITNVGVMGAGELRWTPNSQLDDGLIEICVIRARSLRHYLELLWSYIVGREHPHLQETIPVRDTARIAPSRPLAVQGDGEDLAMGPFELVVRERSIAVLAGPTLH